MFFTSTYPHQLAIRSISACNICNAANTIYLHIIFVRLSVAVFHHPCTWIVCTQNYKSKIWCGNQYQWFAMKYRCLNSYVIAMWIFTSMGIHIYTVKYMYNILSIDDIVLLYIYIPKITNACKQINIVTVAYSSTVN